MSTPQPASETAVLARSLLRLARAGAYALPAPQASAGAYHVFSPRNGFEAAIACLSQADISQAQAQGWLTLPGSDGRLTLSRQGRRALKREICAPGKRPASGMASGHRASKPRSALNAPSAAAPQRIEGPLLWLRNRKDRQGQPLISQGQYEAGTRFASDYTKAQMQARVTASWSVIAPCLRTGTPGAGVDISDAALAARGRFHAAMDVVGPEMGQLLVDVCCHDIGLESAERARGWPVRSGKVVLDMGLTALARHYGLVAVPTAREAAASKPSRQTAARHWADPAFTPTLARWERPQAPAASRDADATASA